MNISVTSSIPYMQLGLEGYYGMLELEGRLCSSTLHVV